MASSARRSERTSNIWPGFVDALATLLMVIIFLLMVFVLAQFFLNEAITGRDTALERLQSQVSELADLLALERKASVDLSVNVEQLSEELQSSVALRDDLSATIRSLTLSIEGAEEKALRAQSRAETAEERALRAQSRAETAEERARKARLRADSAEESALRLQAALEDAYKTVEADKEKIQVQLMELAALSQQVAALRALKEELESKVRLTESEMAEERNISDTARAQVALLNKQMAALRTQLKQLATTLDKSEKLASEQKVQISSLGKRLNAALATKVQELSRYRSEFFGRLRKVLGRQPGIRIVGDRFVFQSEVLFSSGSAELGELGVVQMGRLAATLNDISSKIPKDINWILRVDGHTDHIPINTYKFPSNWELSTARAISVVKFLTSQGIPANRLTAAGFGEFQPLDARDDEIAMRRNRRIELKLTQR